jgi:hypothetical protein
MRNFYQAKVNKPGYVVKAKPIKEIIEHKIEDVFAASVAAYRINCFKYIKDPIALPSNMSLDCSDTDFIKNKLLIDSFLYYENTDKYTVYQPNKILLRTILKDNLQSVTEEDREKGILIRNYWQEKIIDILSGKNISQFIRSSIEVAGYETVKSNDGQAIGLIASMPDSYNKYIKYDELNEIKNDALLVSNHVGKIGKRFYGEVKIIQCNYSQKWDCYFINALQNNNVFMWSFNKKIELEQVINIHGKIKAHRDNGVTQLNYVKID